MSGMVLSIICTKTCTTYTRVISPQHLLSSLFTQFLFTWALAEHICRVFTVETRPWTNQISDMLAWDRRWQVKFAGKKTEAVLISCSCADAKLLKGRLRFGKDTLTIQDSTNILEVEVNSKLSFHCHLESVAHKSFLRVTLDANSLMKLYKA